MATIENHLASCQVCHDRYMALVKYEYESRIKKKTAADEESTPFALRSPDKAQASE
jgi:hypothetical protein